MKKFYFLLALFLCVSISYAQTSKTINVEQAGTLKTLLSETELSTVTNLTVTGNIDARDVKTMRDDMPLLAILDLEKTNIQYYRGSYGTDTYMTGFANQMPDYSFYNRSTNKSKVTLSSITLPNSITSIGKNAFRGCTGLSSIHSPNEIPPSVDNSTFYPSFKNTSFKIVFVPSNSVAAYNDSPDWSNFIIATDKHVTINVPTAGSMAATIINNNAGPLDSITHLKVTGNINTIDINHMNSNMKTLTFLDLTDVSITSNTFPEKAFQDKLTLNSIGLPKSLLSIGNYSFAGCTNLKDDLTLPNKLTSIGNYAFQNCSGFSGELTFPNTLISIGDYAFYNCKNISGELNLPNTITSIGHSAFVNCNSLTGNLILPDSISYIGNSVFNQCSGLTGSLTLPNTITSIGDYAFQGCSGFTGELTLPESIVSIGHSVFKDCSGLTGELTLPNTITSIGYYAFYSCSGFTGKLTLPETITSIGDRAFYNCSGLTELYMTRTLNNIGSNSFGGCKNIELIKSANPTPPTIYESTFTGIPIESCMVDVPTGSVSAYQSADYWNSFIFYNTEAIYNLDASETVCSNQLPYIFGNQELIENGTYTQRFQTSNGTDSIVKLDLTIASAYNLTEEVTTCHGELPYTFGSQELLKSGTYTETFQTVNGCDSTVTLNLTVNSVNTGIIKEENILTAQATDASYQWLNCDNGFAPIIGETNQTFIPNKNGNYAVEITENGCTDISGCFEIFFTEISENSYGAETAVYPNPTTGKVTISLGNNYPKTVSGLHDVGGNLIQKFIFKDKSEIDIDINTNPGVYFIHLQSGNQKAILKVIKK
ncbi:leucine-rich repeat domain-containing protein [Marinilabilia rubra]|uniref:Secretion system C-terminal sorting domain-containing protein n=1 Tax=Marinilabilia rubra TaxID=2162893 RepID=A0A2U2B976_9BACT|nr:leucine-rich repeat domain-containing protein [Marinilabilia rubra]PWD99602.1 hypothetical protein DDZ16_09125 [Marinilabilia rubra]